MDRIGFFHAGFRDGRVQIAGKSYPAGFFSVFLLNNYYKDDTAVRIAVFVSSNLAVQNELSQGLVSVSSFCACAGEIEHILKTLSSIYPFALLDIVQETQRIAELFTQENALLLTDYFQRRAKVAELDEIQQCLGNLPPGYDKKVFSEREQLLQDVSATLRFYSSLGDDLTNAFHKLRRFSARVDETERLDEVHLLPIALEEFGQCVFPVSTEYIPIRKRKDSKEPVVARQMYFGSFFSFILTDFFEGLHHGHYPRRCGVCGSYFLMQSAVRQKYCSGNAPYPVKGKTVTCRKYAARMKAKERADSDPVRCIYKNRCSAIRAEQSKDTILPEYAELAKKIAKRYMQLACEDAAYAETQYPKDMERDLLYAATDREMP